MACYHCAVKVLSRSAGRSSVQFSAYISGEKQYDERLGERFNHTSKEEVCHTEMLFSDRVPEQIQEPEKFWNAVEGFEKSERAQVCRTWEIALPKELDMEENIEWIREYVNDLVEKDNMPAVQWAVHDKKDNPHVHIMAPMRNINEKGEFEIKTRKEYLLDENGERVPVYDEAKLKKYEADHGHPFDIKSLEGLGNKERQAALDEVQKMRIRKGKGAERQWVRVTTESNPWNSKEMLREWRERASLYQNRALEKAHHMERVDHRSYEDQGIERVPMIHEGYNARKMGDRSERVQLNNEIRAVNHNYEMQMNILQMLQNQWQEFLRSIEHVRTELNRRIEEIGKRVRARADGRTDGFDRGDAINERAVRIRKSETDRKDRDAERERPRIKREPEIKRKGRSHDIGR